MASLPRKMATPLIYLRAHCHTEKSIFVYLTARHEVSFLLLHKCESFDILVIHSSNFTLPKRCHCSTGGDFINILAASIVLAEIIPAFGGAVMSMRVARGRVAGDAQVPQMCYTAQRLDSGKLSQLTLNSIAVTAPG